MSIEIINESQEPAWDKMVEDHPLGSVFQTSVFKRVITETFGHCRPYYFAISDQDGTTGGGMPLFLVKSWLTGNRLVSIPWACYADPMVRSAEEFRLPFDAVMKLSATVHASYGEI